MKKTIHINHIDYYIPENRLLFSDNDAFFTEDNKSVFKNAEDFNLFTEKVLNIDGVNVETEKSLETMALELISKNIDAGSIDTTLVRYILIAVDSPDQLKHFGHYIQDKLKLNNANVIRITDNYCANVDIAIGLSKSILENIDELAQVLIITGSKLKNSLENRIVGNYGVMGDSAGIAIISNSSIDALVEIKSQEIITKGELSKIDLEKDNTLLHYQSYVECLTKLIKNNNLSGEDFDAVILHNANQMLIEQALKACGVKKEKINTENHQKYGHLGTTDLLLNLKTHIENSISDNDETILSLNLGVIGSYVSTYYVKHNYYVI